MNKISVIGLKATLIVVGLFGVFLSLDFGVGGFETLGLQGTTDFVVKLDEARFDVQDNHFRFLSGLLGGISVLMIFAVTNLQKYEHALKFSFILILLGGMMRITSGDIDLLLGKDIVGALFAETVLMIGLYLWLDSVIRHLKQAG